MMKDKREYLALGEVAFFLIAWVLGIFSAVDHYRDRANPSTHNDIAATTPLEDGDGALE